MPCSFISHLQFKRMSQQKIAIFPDILVFNTLITQFVLKKNDMVRPYINKRAKKSAFKCKMILLPVIWKNSHWIIACLINPGCILNQSYDEKDKECPW